MRRVSGRLATEVHARNFREEAETPFPVSLEEVRRKDATRRTALETAGRSLLGLVVAFPLPALAASKLSPTDRLLTGYKDIVYLLENWDKETTKCESPTKCVRDADVVRKYLGLRSTKDPLFQAEKTIQQLQGNLDDPDDIEQFISAAEEFSSAQSMANSMAYTSSFGEYNPGGGADAVARYLEISRKQVIICKSALEKVLKLLKLI
uniref:Uncharacterized protein n=1 Tax=Chromera velia CCMP2878 TaxID=1169474 RepID=A0A0G4HPE9_9ALVE|eukprot:Cvel_7758.t1-p1 / transcript=Cvel_7758.t1 / gene=Cvel_7758 / organism=Chromera_velia_CCMP2878 / gene_product=hypothetical protein / transcript_product=hypothetical protein / location=Cvel_scaffold413:50308-50925(-) / protein_length=206 / sequence_SO=supercontig / SO=protein_coding / is_pseudo=false